MNIANQKPVVYLQVTEADLEKFGLALIAKAREDYAAQQKESTVEEWGTRKDACTYLGGISLPTLHSMMNAGEVRFRKAGRRTLIDMGKLRRDWNAGRIGQKKTSNTSKSDD